MTQISPQFHRKKVAIVGGGISGISAAEYLSPFHEITLFEKNKYLGGHTNTIVVPEEPTQNVAVDTGFIVFNKKNYPNFCKLLKTWNVASQDTDMSFSYSAENQMYAGINFNSLFARRKNLFNPKHWRMLLEILKFGKNGIHDLQQNLNNITLRDYLKPYNYSQKMISEYLVPMGAAIWSASFEAVLEFPAKAYLHFFNNHGLLDLRTLPQWQTIKGGSFSYVKAFQKKFSGKIFLNAQILSITRQNQKVQIQTPNQTHEFDDVILAVHANQVLPLLKDASSEEKTLFSQWQYSINPTALHTDTQFLPQKKSAWAAWNYRKPVNHTDNVDVTYYMNRLQNLKTKKNYCVTLNSNTIIAKAHLIKEIQYEHPLFSQSRFDTQDKIKNLSGTRNTHYCGSYLGYGFHEDAVKSSVDMVKKWGVMV